MEQHIPIDFFPIIKDGINLSYIKNIILIDKTIKNSEIFFLSNNNETLPIYYNYYTDRDKLFEYLEKEFISIDRIAFIFDNSMMNNKYFLNNELFFTENDIIKFQNNEKCLENYSSNFNFLIKMSKKFNIKNIDFLACNSLEYNNWKIYYELLKHFLPTIIGASNDLTGNIKYGGDWIMENTNEDIQNTYFNENITNYSSTLFSSSISYSVLLFSGRTGFLFIIETTNNFSNLVLNNFTNLNFESHATDLQKIYNVYYREKDIGVFVLASDVNNLNINLLPNKRYEIILNIVNYDIYGNGLYIYNTSTIPINSVLVSTNELKMYPSNSSWFVFSTFNPNDLTTYNTLKNGEVRNQALTLNYTVQVPNLVQSGGDPIIQPLFGPKFALASHIKYVNLLADYSKKIFINAQVEMLTESDFPPKIYWDSGFTPISELTHIYANSYYRKFYIKYQEESIEIDADTLVITNITNQTKIKIAKFKPITGLKSISFDKIYPLLKSTIGLKVGFGNYLLTLTSDINTDDRHHLELLDVRNTDLSKCSGALISKDKIIRISSLFGVELEQFMSDPFQMTVNI